ncbi:MAG: AraC family transcriptional regulator [Nitrospiraceae bacterium]|nr:AraC family transcriptional regulator [Nitrospiraceae bacterium]
MKKINFNYDLIENRMNFYLSFLGRGIAQLAGSDGRVETEIPGLSLFRREKVTSPDVGMYEPSICILAQGAKRVLLGENAFDYNSRHFLITSLDLPTFVQVIEATREEPCLGLVLRLDRNEISRLMADGMLPPPDSGHASCGMGVGEVTLPLITSFVRLMDLLLEPKDIPFLAPMIQREIYYHLLVGDQGGRLRQMASADCQSRQIALVVEWLKNNFRSPVKIDDLAVQAGMSLSTFYQHFRVMTAMSPLQYQKKLRLNEARRLMLSEHLDAATAALYVGYESPSQFSREYSRLFGNPPLKDIKYLREISSVEL